VLISLIVCTHDRARLLASAYRQNLALLADHAGSFEALFVASACSDGSREVASSLLATASVPGRVIATEVPGLSVARNLGLEHAAGDYFWFLDDDVFLTASWPEHALRAAAEYAVAGGRTLPFVPGAAQVLRSAAGRSFLSVVDLGCADRPFPRHQGPVGANFGFSRAAWEHAGRPQFDPALGRVRLSLRSGEEVAFLRALGSPATYVAQAAVLHWIDPARLEMGWWSRRLAAEAESLATVRSRLRLLTAAAVHVARGMLSLNPSERRIRLQLAGAIVRRCR
jgi:hypothetical protein